MGLGWAPGSYVLVVVVGDVEENVLCCFGQSSSLCSFPVGKWELCSQSRAPMVCSAHIEVTTAHKGLQAWNSFSRRSES